jgi:2-keto-3-deoxy-L-rhamnonate aldolase RhmA
MMDMKKSLERGDRLVGMLNFSGSSKIIELMALSGLDFGIIDTEHAVASWESCDHMVLTAKAAGLPVLIRVSDPREIDVLHALDTGADGIVVSHVSDAQTAERIVSHAYYAPRGIRGMCPAIRPAQYGKINWEKYAEHANEKMIVICLVEDRTGLENVESIAAVKGVDAVWCGSGDLSQSLGIPHSGTEHPQMAAAMARIRDACKGNGKAFMATAGSRPTAEYVDRLWEFGATVVSIAPDMMLIQNAFTDIVKTIKHGKC